MIPLVVVTYLAVAVFVGAVVIRWVKIARMPVHLRWELYPVAREKSSAHGASFLEHLDGWNARPSAGRLGDIKIMVPEILLLRGVHAHNRSLWLRSYPFHFGLYLLGAFAGLLAFGAIAELFGVRIGAGAAGFGFSVSVATTLVGVAGLVLLGAGALGLLLRRISYPALRSHSATADFFNLVAFLAAAVLGLLAFAIADRDFSLLRGFVRALVTLRPSAETPTLVAAEIVVGSALLAYIPLTHMSHFFTKWFMYHDVRWNDEVNRKGSKLEAAIERQLGYQVGWNAAHIRGEGKRTWVDVATEEVSKQ